MNMENRARISEFESDPRQRVFPYYREVPADEIELGSLIRDLIGEWKIMAAVLAIGAIGSIAAAIYMPKIYRVEAILRVPTFFELGDIRDQDIIEVTPQDTMMRVIDKLLAPEIHLKALQSSSLGKQLLENSEASNDQLTQQLREDFSLNIVNHDYYQVEKGDKTPLREISVSLKSDEPELAADFIQVLIAQAQSQALLYFSKDVSTVKDNRISDIQEHLEAMTLAAKQSREAEIMRLQEANDEVIARLQQQIDLTIRKTRQDRENRIIQLADAINTAELLGINEPVTWDDLRPLRKSIQINNELGDKNDAAPLYFHGTRLLRAELDQLRNRTDDRPFVPALTALEYQIVQLQTDTKIMALQSRANDTIYIEKFDDLQQQLKNILRQPEQFSNSQLAVISQPATVPSGPMRSPFIIVGIGLVLSGFLALLVAFIRMAMRNGEPQRQGLSAVD